MTGGFPGAVFAFEASRLARNGRDWHTLLEICALVESVLVDEEAVYDPRQPNDRLLLGMKGTFSEMLRGFCGPANRSRRQCSLESLPRKAFPNGATHLGPTALKSPVTRNHQIGQTQEYQMINTMQPIVNLVNANLNATTRFMQSPDIAELTKSNIDKYVKVTQESFAYLAQSGAMRQWSRDSMDNVSRFANEYLQSVFGVFGQMTQGQNLFANRMQDFSNKVEQGVEATVQAFDQSAEEIEGQAEESVEEGVDAVSHFSRARAKQQSKAR